MPKTAPYSKQFTLPLLNWFDQFGRKDLPWQHPRTAYRIWVSEIMLQQTQVKTVIPYFERFITQFPELNDLANADEEEVLALWAGLGYYSRARHLYRAAKMIQQEFQGVWPQDIKTLSQLPGVGRSTAAAIASQAFNLPTPILDGNVKRVLCRYFLVEGYPEDNAVKTQLWNYAELCMSKERCVDYSQAIMDLGATCCTSRNPQCHQCPLQNTCQAYIENRVLEFPHKKTKKKLPTKEQQFLLIADTINQKIYLEKKPPTGVWGSLWCLPNISTTENPIDYLQQIGHHQISNTTHQLMAFKHTFSHFHLQIQVVLLEIKSQSNQRNFVKETSGKWFSLADALKQGIPAPVEKIIKRYAELNIA